jgi:hypothetical protein
MQQQSSAVGFVGYYQKKSNKGQGMQITMIWPWFDKC